METSLFDPNEQSGSKEARVVYALERVSEAFRVLLWRETRRTGLSPIQLQLLIFIHYHGQTQSRVSYLANEFGMTKATISEVVKTLMLKKLVRKEVDPKDSRSAIILLTLKGEEVAREVSLFAQSMSQSVKKLPLEQKEIMLIALQNLLFDLNKSEVVGHQRMCLTCQHHEKHGAGEHFCRLFRKTFPADELRFDCYEHKTQA